MRTALSPFLACRQLLVRSTKCRPVTVNKTRCRYYSARNNNKVGCTSTSGQSTRLAWHNRVATYHSVERYYSSIPGTNHNNVCTQKITQPPNQHQCVSTTQLLTNPREGHEQGRIVDPDSKGFHRLDSRYRPWNSHHQPGMDLHIAEDLASHIRLLCPVEETNQEQQAEHQSHFPALGSPTRIPDLDTDLRKH